MDHDDDTSIKEEHPRGSNSPSAPADMASSGGHLDDMSDGPVNNGGFSGPQALRPVFFGNLVHDVTATEVADIFERPVLAIPGPAGGDPTRPIPVDRVDLKRGFCFVFLRDAVSAAEKERAEQFVSKINGMEIPKVSKALRAEFARGDGRIKRKEDDRRKKIQPSETLFVVNFHEETTKREDLQMLFEPFGELVRIDMKRNYAFVQFTSIENARRAKESTNGGKLDQSVITVEYVARRMGEGDDRRSGGGRDRNRDRGGYRGPPRGPPPGEYGRGGYRDRDDYRGGGRGREDRLDDFRGRDDPYEERRGGSNRGRDRSPPRDTYRPRARSRTRSRSPPVYRHRSRTPSPRRERDEYRGGGRGAGYDDHRGGGRPRSSERDYREGSRARSSERDYRGDARGYK